MKPIAWIAALLSLLGLGAFFLRTPQQPGQAGLKHTPAPAKAPRGMPEKTGVRTSTGVSTDTATGDVPRSREESDELLRKARAGLAEVASRMTPERQVQLMDSHMQMRDAGYRKLFSSWNLDEATVAKTLTIIRDREARLLEKKLHHMKEGPSYTSAFLKEQKLEKELAEVELVILLGQEKFNELTSREAEMDAEVQARAREIMEARKR